MIIRAETASDSTVIRSVTEAAFLGAEHSSGTEGAIVDALRDAGALTLSLVAEQDGAMVGHVAFSPVRIGGRDLGWFGLGPVSVLPSLQRGGIGKTLIEAGLEQLRQRGASGCVVLGDPAYYGRFGFTADHELHYPDVPPEYFQSMPWTGASAEGEVSYHPAFGAA